MKNYYDILEVSRTASKDTINKIFKIHMKANHPDLFQGEEKKKAEEKSKEFTEAYNVLSDDNERAKYDAQLAEEENLNSNEKMQTIIQENEYLKQVIAKKDALLSKLTNSDFSQFNDYSTSPQQVNNTNNIYNRENYGGFNGFTPKNPYEGMSLEELQNLKKEETKRYYFSLFKEYGIKILILVVIFIVMLLSLMSSFNDLKNSIK